MTDYAKVANESRKKCLDLVYKAQTSHIGSLFSCADVMAVLFDKIDLDKDKFVLSAGWKAAMLYFHLWKKGRITEEQLNSYCQPGSPWIGLSEPIHPDIPVSGGSMGLGLPGAVGLALAKKLKGEEGTVYVLMSDGELQCGTTWESALIARHHQLRNLVVLIDGNGFQAMGRTEDILTPTFPNEMTVAHGHDYQDIAQALERSLDRTRPWGINNIVFATVKGKGVSFMENNNLYHYKQLSETEYNEARKELDG